MEGEGVLLVEIILRGPSQFLYFTFGGNHPKFPSTRLTASNAVFKKWWKEKRTLFSLTLKRGCNVGSSQLRVHFNSFMKSRWRCCEFAYRSYQNKEVPFISLIRMSSYDGVVGQYFFEDAVGEAVIVNINRYRGRISEFSWSELNTIDLGDA